MGRIPQELAGIPGEKLEAVRRAILALERDGKNVTQRATREIAKIDQRVNSKVVKAYKAGRMPDPLAPWSQASAESTHDAGDGEDERDESKSRAELERLVEQIRAARTHEDRMRVQQEAGAMALQGKLEKWQLTAVHDTLQEARKEAKTQREIADAGADRVLLAGEESYALVRAYEGIVCGDRRARILELVAAAAEADLEEHPDVDTSPEADLDEPPVEAVALP